MTQNNVDSNLLANVKYNKLIKNLNVKMKP